MVYLFLEWNHLEFAEALNQLKRLHVQGSQAGVIKSFGHDPEGVTHVDLIHAVAGQQIGGRELYIVAGFG